MVQFVVAVNRVGAEFQEGVKSLPTKAPIDVGQKSHRGKRCIRSEQTASHTLHSQTSLRASLAIGTFQTIDALNTMAAADRWRERTQFQPCMTDDACGMRRKDANGAHAAQSGAWVAASDAHPLYGLTELEINTVNGDAAAGVGGHYVWSMEWFIRHVGRQKTIFIAQGQREQS